MLCEMRTYQVQPGRAPAFLKFYEEHGLPIISQYARLVGCWTKESGVLNAVVFIWAYDDYAHRSQQRTLLGADPQWQSFIPTMLPWLVHQESVFMTAAAFSPGQ